MKKLVLILLSLVLAMTVLLSCSDKKEKPTATTGADSTSQPDASVTTQSTTPEPSVTTSHVQPNPPITTTEKPKEHTMGNPVYSEMWRPGYHFTAEDSWINDPNGLTYFNGVYHIYYQTNPHVNSPGKVHWGHATSTDLVHFTEHNTVLAPDASGDMWSGTSYVDSDNRSGLFDESGSGLIVAYSTHTQKIGLAYSEDGFKFKKLGIVINNTTIADFRDPKLFFDDISGKWTMVVAGGKVRFYQSDDPESWTLVSENEIYTECPDFFPLRVEGTDTAMWVLTCAGRHAFVGEWDGTSFTPKSSQIPLNYGPDNYAGIIFSADKDGRTLMVNWMNNWSYTQPADGIWAGANTLINSLSLIKNGKNYRIVQTPIKEYESLYKEKTVSVENTAFDGKNLFDKVSSQSYLLDITIDLSEKKNFALSFYNGENDLVLLSYDASTRTLTADRSKSVLGIDAMKNTYSTYSMVLSSNYIKNSELDLSIYVDSSSIEIYALGNTHLMALRTQPLTTSRGLSISADDGLLIKSASVTELDNIYFDDPDSIDAVHALLDEVIINAESEDELFRNVSSYGAVKDFTAESLDPKIASVTKTDGGITIKALSEGKTKIKLAVGYTYVYIPVTVLEKESFSSDITNINAVSGTLSKTPNGYLFRSSGGDSFAFSDVYASDFSYSADLTFVTDGAAALVFRAKDTRNFYCLCLDRAGRYIKIWCRKDGNTKDLSGTSYSLALNKTYNVKIDADGNLLTVYIDGKKLFSVNDTSHLEGTLGLNVFNSNTLFNNIEYELKGADEGEINSMIESFMPVFGTVAKTPNGFLISNSSGDGFASSDVTASDFTYSASVKLNPTTPGAALVFRMNGASNFYCATIDVGANIVKLWKKTNGDVSVVKTVSLALEWDTGYTVTVNAVGEKISILVDGKELISVEDPSHSAGSLGINVFSGSAYFNDIEYEIIKQ